MKNTGRQNKFNGLLMVAKMKANARDKMSHGGDFNLETMIKIYAAYQDMCDRAGLVDFAEILLRSFELLKNNSEIRQHYQQRFRQILVDEFRTPTPSSISGCGYWQGTTPG